MRKQYDEDLFKDTTMTFGEHLEELRARLWRALVGLAVGFVIGLYFGGSVVDLIETPLKNALTEYYQEQSLEQTQENLAVLRRLGYRLPEDPERLKDFLAEATLEDGTRLSDLKFSPVYLNPTELLRALKQANPQQFQNIALPPEEPDKAFDKRDLVPVFLWRPIAEDVQVTSLSAHEPFLIYVKASLLVGALLSGPWIFYQIWVFVAAGLYPHEKRYVHVFLPFSLALFFAGAALAFFFVFGPVLQFLFHFNDTLGIQQDIRISEWLGFVLLLPLGFGISFQLPLVMLFLQRIGIFDVEAYVSKWRLAILVIFTLSMFLTPADPTSMILMAVPLTVLYFGGILLCIYMPPNRSPFDDELGSEAAPPPSQPQKPAKPKRSRGERAWLILRMGLLVVLVVLLFGWQPWRRGQQQRALVSQIEQLGGKVYYDYQHDVEGKRNEAARPPSWGGLRWLLGDDFFDAVVEIDLSGTAADDALLKRLSQLSTLKRISLAGTQVSREAIEQFRQAVPDCRITGGPK